jgi:hypothetical protein
MSSEVDKKLKEIKAIAEAMPVSALPGAFGFGYRDKKIIYLSLQQEALNKQLKQEDGLNGKDFNTHG